MPIKRIGILTGGGDAPGLNAVIRAVTVKGIHLGFEVYGFEEGWRGVINKKYRELKMEDIEDIHTEGGTILFSSRTNIAKMNNGIAIAKKNLEDLGIDVMVAAGGDDTLGVAYKLHQAGAKVVGVPKTIDNDVNATDYTFGFDTAINRVSDFFDMLRTTTRSHKRIMVVELMGRRAGWIALQGGMAGGAHLILIPEFEMGIKEICAILRKRIESGKTWAMIAVAEGAVVPELMKDIAHSAKRDEFGHEQLGTGKGIAETLANAIEYETGFETRHIVLGHLQRGGSPTAFDRVLGTRLGVHVVNMISEGQFGMMASMQGSVMETVPLEEAVKCLKKVSKKIYGTAQQFFG